jgi:hypothetical protein
MGTRAQPLAGSALLLRGIRHFAPVGVVVFQSLGERVTLGIRETVPTPLRLRAQRNSFVVGVGKRLQPSDIRREGEAAVAD